MSYGRIHYAATAYQTTLIAEHSSIDENMNEKVIQIIQNFDTNKRNAVFEQDDYIFFLMTDQSRLTFICFTDRNVSSNKRSFFLKELSTKWHRQYDDNASNFEPFSKNSEFGPEIRTLMYIYNSERTQEIFKQRSLIQAAQEQMTGNLAKDLKREDQLQEVEQKAEGIKKAAQLFYRKSVSKIQTIDINLSGPEEMNGSLGDAFKIDDELQDVEQETDNSNDSSHSDHLNKVE